MICFSFGQHHAAIATLFQWADWFRSDHRKRVVLPCPSGTSNRDDHVTAVDTRPGTNSRLISMGGVDFQCDIVTLVIRHLDVGGPVSTL